jgi:hypothetical protein
MIRVLRMVLLALLTSSGTEAQEEPRQIALGAAHQEESQWIVPLLINDISQVLGIDIDLVFDHDKNTLVKVRGAELLSGFFILGNVLDDTLKISAASAQANEGGGIFAEIVLAEGPAPPDFVFSLVVLNGGQIEVEYEPRFIPPRPTAVGEAASQTADGFALAQNIPNPFNAATTLSFRLAAPSYVKLAIYNASGQGVRTLVDGVRPAGAHQLKWQGRDERDRAVASGLYFYRLQAGESTQIRRMLLLK